MKLLDLHPQFLRYQRTLVPVVGEDAEGDLHGAVTEQVFLHHVDKIEDAQGIFFLCPKCYEANGGEVGTHGVICWSRKAPDEAQPGPGRWSLHGTCYADLSLEGDPPGAARSVQLLGGGCNWHGFVTNGEAV